MKIPVCIRSEYVIIGIPPFFRLEGSAPPKRVSRPALWFSCLTFYHTAAFSSILFFDTLLKPISHFIQFIVQSVKARLRATQRIRETLPAAGL